MMIDRETSCADRRLSMLAAITPVLVAAILLANPARAATPILFLDDCSTGCVYTPGPEDSRINRSSILSQTAALSAYPHGSASFQQVVECVRTTFAPFAR